MRRADSPNIAPGLAGTLIALVAVAATAAAVPAPYAAPAECRAAVMDSQPVRAVAAVVAAACDLLGIDRPSDVAVTPQLWNAVAAVSKRPVTVDCPVDARPLAPPLREDLLNLPPPIC